MGVGLGLSSHLTNCDLITAMLLIAEYINMVDIIHAQSYTTLPSSCEVLHGVLWTWLPKWFEKNKIIKNESWVLSVLIMVHEIFM